jgi:hypothetical protein
MGAKKKEKGERRKGKEGTTKARRHRGNRNEGIDPRVRSIGHKKHKGAQKKNNGQSGGPRNTRNTRKFRAIHSAHGIHGTHGNFGRDFTAKIAESAEMGRETVRQVDGEAVIQPGSFSLFFIFLFPLVCGVGEGEPAGRKRKDKD